MIGYILHKTFSKYKAKKWWDLSLVSLQGLLFFKMCNTFKLFSFLFLSLLETHSHTGFTIFILRSWDPPGKKYANLYIYIFLNVGITTSKYQSVCVTFPLIIFFHLSQLFPFTLHSPRVVLNLRYQEILRPERVKLNLQEYWALKGCHRPINKLGLFADFAQQMQENRMGQMQCWENILCKNGTEPVIELKYMRLQPLYTLKTPH